MFGNNHFNARCRHGRSFLWPQSTALGGWRAMSARTPRTQVSTQRRGTEMTLHVEGALDHEARVVWDRCTSDVLDARPTAVTVDLAAARVIASSGMRMLVDLCHQLQVAGIPHTLANVPPHVAPLIGLAGLDAPAV